MTTHVQSWEPFAKESTLEVLTIDQTTQEHWSKFWLVVIDEEMYLRLGSCGAARIAGNTTNPFVSIKLAGQRFDNVRVIPEPKMVEQVAAAIAKEPGHLAQTNERGMRTHDRTAC